jgi:hypothetical protein
LVQAKPPDPALPSSIAQVATDLELSLLPFETFYRQKVAPVGGSIVIAEAASLSLEVCTRCLVRKSKRQRREQPQKSFESKR